MIRRILHDGKACYPIDRAAAAATLNQHFVDFRFGSVWYTLTLLAGGALVYTERCVLS